MAAANRKLVYAAIKGTVFGLDRATGAEVWRTPLKGSDFVNLVLDGDDLFATARGEIFCLDPDSGRIRWNNPMTGYGGGLMTIATSDGNPIAAVAEHRRRQEASNAAASST
jgi:outer membrane protein assembly factor BamB